MPSESSPITLVHAAFGAELDLVSSRGNAGLARNLGLVKLVFQHKTLESWLMSHVMQDAERGLGAGCDSLDKQFHQSSSAASLDSSTLFSMTLSILSMVNSSETAPRAR